MGPAFGGRRADGEEGRTPPFRQACIIPGTTKERNRIGSSVGEPDSTQRSKFFVIATVRRGRQQKHPSRSQCDRVYGRSTRAGRRCGMCLVHNEQIPSCVFQRSQHLGASNELGRTDIGARQVPWTDIRGKFARRSSQPRGGHNLGADFETLPQFGRPLIAESCRYDDERTEELTLGR